MTIANPLALSLRPVIRAAAAHRLMALALALISASALAQDDPAAELDALSRETATGAGGLALARSQSGSGDLLGALATIDRILMTEPTAGQALLLRASLLCRIDDKAGGAAQFARLRKRDFARNDWAQASQACAKPKSTPTRRNSRWPPPGL